MDFSFFGSKTSFQLSYNNAMQGMISFLTVILLGQQYGGWDECKGCLIHQSLFITNKVVYKHGIRRTWDKSFSNLCNVYAGRCTAFYDVCGCGCNPILLET